MCGTNAKWILAFILYLKHLQKMWQALKKHIVLEFFSSCMMTGQRNSLTIGIPIPPLCTYFSSSFFWAKDVSGLATYSLNLMHHVFLFLSISLCLIIIIIISLSLSLTQV